MTLFKKLLYAGVFVALFNWFNKKKEPVLMALNIQPGPWFKSYLSDWMEHHGVLHLEHVTSGIVTGEISGDYIWVTDTPEFDRKWFADRGFDFPSKWVEYKHMTRVVGEEGGPALMPGL